MLAEKRWSVVSLLIVALAGSCLGQRAHAQSLLNGFWNPLMTEDIDERIPGPDQGDYAGLPVTPAAVKAARTWDPEELTQLEIQCRPHPSIYGIRGVGNLRIWEDRDPYTNQQNDIETWIAWQQQHRIIHMDPNYRHPPPWANETWQGISVGHWVGNVLYVHTDGVRAAWVRRNGLPTTDKAQMEERFFRYGTLLTHILMVTDPVYLSEPMVKSNGYELAPDGTMDPYPCQSANEIPRAAGIEPMNVDYNPTLDEWAVRQHVPVKAAMGGADSMYPEYQDYIKSLPPNPPLSQIEAAEKKHYAEEGSR
jgi:hypothetical protein